MKYEIEMLSLGDADSFIIKILENNGYEKVILIDSGNVNDSQKIINNLSLYTKGEIDVAICTHPDEDHIDGFFKIIDNIPIKEFWIHNPNNYITKRKFKEVKSKLILTEGLKKVLKGLEDNYDLISKIESKRIPIFEPFSDSTEQHIDIHAKILGPTKNYYKQLLPRFKDYHKLIIEGEKSRRDKSASNNSSVILLFDLNYKEFLFTGDAGIDAFYQIEDMEIILSSIYWLKIPHHGSKKNLDKDLIWLFNPCIAFVTSIGYDSLLDKSNIDFLKLLGCKVYSSERGNILHSNMERKRKGYIKATTL